MTTIHEIVKILTDSGIEPNEANVEVKILIEHFAGYGVKDILLGKKLDSEKCRRQSQTPRTNKTANSAYNRVCGFYG